jgi:hypothetical protein
VRRISRHESALFWCAIAAGLIPVGGILLGVGLARQPKTGSIWADGWFAAGFGVMILGCLALVWALILYLAHREETRPSAQSTGATEGRGASRGPIAEWRPPVEPEALARYLDEVNRTMDERGFGRNPNLAPQTVSEPTEPTPSWQALNDKRVERYEHNRGLFLIHEWTPSAVDGQEADVVIRVCQHGDGPLSRGEIQVVEYSLGPKFTNHSLVCTDPADGFAISVSMWGPMLCLAKVYFRDSSPPLILDRYVNFSAEISSGVDQ